MDLEFSGELWYWRGPAPWYFVTVPVEKCELLRVASKFVTYGWGMIPVTASVGRTSWQTSLFPKDGRYLVPVKASVRAAEELEVGDRIRLVLRVAGVQFSAAE